jgi:hypothetical protein
MDDRYILATSWLRLQKINDVVETMLIYGQISRKPTILGVTVGERYAINISRKYYTEITMVHVYTHAVLIGKYYLKRQGFPKLTKLCSRFPRYY